MTIKNEIIAATREHFKSHIRKHLTNIHIILHNPTAIPDHTDVMDALEKELAIVDEYDSKLTVLEKYLKEDVAPTAAVQTPAAVPMPPVERPFTV